MPSEENACCEINSLAEGEAMLKCVLRHEFTAMMI